MIDHLGISVRDFALSKAFYLSALAPLGISVVKEVPGHKTVGLGADRNPFFWISEAQVHGTMHLAFTATTRAQVDAFYNAAMKAGAMDNGPPGLRPHYHPNYYGAFVIDSNGINLEAVCHTPG